MPPTLGELHLRAWAIIDDYAFKSDWQTFTGGFIAGQMEKIFSGACEACMFAPDEMDFDWCYELVSCISNNVYGLAVHVLQCSNRREIWATDPAIGSGFLRELESMVKSKDENCPHWHLLRGNLCGIPSRRIDPNYHLRYDLKEA